MKILKKRQNNNNNSKEHVSPQDELKKLPEHGRVLFIATVVKTHIMEFHIPYLKMFKEMGWETAVAARNDFDDPADCVIPYCDHYYDIPFERNPFKPANIRSYRMLRKVIDEGGYDIIHCHTPVGGTLGRLAASAARKKGCEVVYTAHGFHFYKGSPKSSWLLFYPVERLLARKTDVLIVINSEDRKTAGPFKAGRTVYIPGVGIDTDKFASQREDGTSAEEGKTITLLSVGEVNRNKNHKVIIEALPLLGDLGDLRYIICGRGPLIEEYRALAQELGVSDKLILTGYRTDVPDFYAKADLFVFPSYREGLPVAVMEAMAAGLPIVCTENRGTRDMITEGVNGYFFDADDPASAATAIRKALADADRLSAANREASETFSIGSIMEEYKEAYGFERPAGE